MARIRTIKPEFWSDERITECSLSAQLLFIATWNFADDAGNLERSAKQLKARAFPTRTIDCEPLIQELLAQKLLLEYAADGKFFLHIQNFAKHQLINRPSKPICPVFTEDSLRTHVALTEHSLQEGLGREGLGRVRKKTPAPSVKKNGHDFFAEDRPPVCLLPLVSGEEYAVSTQIADELAKAYPAVDVPQTLQEIRAWSIANPKNRKTKGGILRHINGWCARLQDRAPRLP